MGDKVTSSTVVGTHVVDGVAVTVERLTWRDAPGFSFDVIAAATGDVLTMESSFDEYPTEDQIRSLL